MFASDDVCESVSPRGFSRKRLRRAERSTSKYAAIRCTVREFETLAEAEKVHRVVPNNVSAADRMVPKLVCFSLARVAATAIYRREFRARA